MAENGASTNGHRPARRRKHIYPPLEQMVEEQAAAAARPRVARAVKARAAESKPDFGPEPEAPPAAPVMTAMPPDEAMIGSDAAALGSDDSPLGLDDAPPAFADAGSQSEAGFAEPAETALAAAADDDLVPTDAERVELRLSAVGMVDAGDVQFTQGALGAARADNVSVDQGAVGAALAGNVEVSRGYARSILARQVSLDRAVARVVVAADVKAERSAVMLLIARHVSGDVRVLLDWRGAAAFGAVAGVVFGLLRRIPGLGSSGSGKR